MKCFLKRGTGCLVSPKASVGEAVDPHHRLDL
jgi:hypothetical protein